MVTRLLTTTTRSFMITVLRSRSRSSFAVSKRKKREKGKDMARSCNTVARNPSNGIWNISSFSLPPREVLQRRVFVVPTPKGNQLVMRPRLAHFAILDEISTHKTKHINVSAKGPTKSQMTTTNSHAVRILYRGEAVRDGDRRPALGRLVQRILHDLLRRRVQRGSRLIPANKKADQKCGTNEKQRLRFTSSSSNTFGLRNSARAMAMRSA